MSTNETRLRSDACASPSASARSSSSCPSHGSVSVADLATELAVSPATIRRDLELLDDQRLLTRTHGGAVAQGVLYELPLRYKTAHHQEEKRRIAVEAASRVADGEAVGLTGGTTTTEVARVLVERQRLTVVTNALNIASELAIRPNLKLVVTGGWARSESYELVGPLAEQALAGLNLDTVFLGVDGVVARGRIHDPPRGGGAHEPRADGARAPRRSSSPTARRSGTSRSRGSVPSIASTSSSPTRAPNAASPRSARPASSSTR